MQLEDSERKKQEYAQKLKKKEEIAAASKLETRELHSQIEHERAMNEEIKNKLKETEHEYKALKKRHDKSKQSF